MDPAALSFLPETAVSSEPRGFNFGNPRRTNVDFFLKASYLFRL
jgi:hypothetical protein